MRVTARVFVPLLVLTLGATSCSKKPNLGVVTGQVTIGSEPVSGGTIVFENRDAGVAVNASIRDDGSFEFRTHEGAGLPAGTYTVAVFPGATLKDDSEAPLIGNAPPPPPSKSKIPPKFHTNASSPLRAEVKAGKNPPFHFDLSQ